MTLLEHTFHKHLNLIFEIKDTKSNIELFSKKYGINDASKIQNTFRRFNQVLPKLKNKDIFAYESLNDLETTINPETNSEKKKDIKSKGSEKVYENDKCVVYHIKNAEASCLLGKGTKWCISGDDADTHFNGYSKKVNIYFVFDKSTKEKYAIVVYTEGSVEVFNSADEKIDYSELKDFDIPNSIYKPKEFNIKEHINGRITENPDGSIDVNGSVNLIQAGLTKIPVKFRKVSGYFYCSTNNLTSLENCPEEVGGSFKCNHNKLKNLNGSPKKVGDFMCVNNELTSLEGAPREVEYDFNCANNKLITLKGAPEKVGTHFNCDNNYLTTLEGSPKEVGHNFYCGRNKLTNLEGAPDKIGGYLYCEKNPIIDYTYKGPLSKKIIKYA